MGVLEGPGYGAAAHAAQAEVVRLLAEEVDDDEVVGEQDAGLAQATDRLDGAEHPDDAVEAAAALDGVGVRAGDYGAGELARARQRADQVGGGVGAHAEAGVFHPRRHPLAPGAVIWGEGTPRPARCLRVAVRGQRLEVAGHPGEVGRCRRAHEEDELG